MLVSGSRVPQASSTSNRSKTLKKHPTQIPPAVRLSRYPRSWVPWSKYLLASVSSRGKRLGPQLVGGWKCWLFSLPETYMTSHPKNGGFRFPIGILWNSRNSGAFAVSFREGFGELFGVVQEDRIGPQPLSVGLWDLFQMATHGL